MITVTAPRMTHITVGDGSGGGHMYGSADPLKSKFPQGWDAIKIRMELLAVANDPNATKTLQPNGKHRIVGLDSAGNSLTVIANGSTVVTAYPG